MSLRIRQIKPGFFMNEDLADMHPLCRLLFIGLWLLADREGRFEYRPKRIRAEIFPYDSSTPVEGFLADLTNRGFIERYEVGGIQYASMTTWHKHQRPDTREKQSDLPAPPKRSHSHSREFQCTRTEAAATAQTAENGKKPTPTGIRFQVPDAANLTRGNSCPPVRVSPIECAVEREFTVIPVKPYVITPKLTGILPWNLELGTGNWESGGGVFTADCSTANVRKNTPPPSDEIRCDSEQTPPLKKEPGFAETQTPPLETPVRQYRSPVPTDEEIDKALAEMRELGIDTLGPDALRTQGGRLERISEIAETSLRDFGEIAAQSRQEAPERIAAVSASDVREQPVEPKQAHPVSQQRASDAMGDFQLMRQSLADLAKRVGLPAPDDQMVAKVIDAGHGATAVEIHAVLTRLYKRDKFRSMRSWGLLPVVLDSCFTHAATA